MEIERRDLPPQPLRWTTYDANLDYRRVTEAEALANGWSPYAYLVHADAGFYPSGTNPIHLVAPYGNGQTEEFDLAYDHELPPISIAELGYGMPSTSEEYGLALYTEPGSDAAVVVGDPRRRALAGFLEVGTEPSTVRLQNGEPTWVLDAIVLPDGSLPNLSKLLLVTPTAGNVPAAPEKGAPVPNDAWSFAMVGEIKWCTNNPTGWAANLAARAVAVHSSVENTTPVHVVQEALLCNMTYSTTVAQTCTDGGSCPLSNAGNPYSYHGCALYGACFNANIKANLLQARSEGHLLPELHLVQIVHQDRPTASYKLPEMGEPIYKKVCGQAVMPGVGRAPDGTTDPNIEPIQEGASIVGEHSICQNPISNIHELGHCLGATHGQALEPGGAGCSQTVMEADVEENCTAFGYPNGLTLASCAKQDSSKLEYSVMDVQALILSNIATVDCPIENDGALLPPP